MADWKIVAAELKAFNARGEVKKAMRKGIREPVPLIRKDIKARALAVMPRSGGLNVWVSGIKVGAQIKILGKGVTMKLKGGRNSAGGRSDINAIDRGRLRHPSWGRRGAGDWHTQAVTPRFFSDPASYRALEVRNAIDRQIDRALDTIRRG